ncbi:MAG: CoA transferase [Alphaproteobacteria bacterium]|nr:CoA transferase [Alphaproteobacteria bacterium]MCB9929459.1 CoA transferase [Alphaproteobacteria bacterium]
MGALDGVKVVELAGIGPTPHCCMLLAEMGADVLRVDRLANVGVQKRGFPEKFDPLTRSRPNVAIDWKNPQGLATIKRLCAGADILIEGFRPGVLERAGLAPETLWAENPKLVIGRATGWGQDGPIAQTAGHDINYISLSGVLANIGPADGPPVHPLMLTGDFGGGSLYLGLGVLAAYISAQKTGQGQVVDAAMLEGSASLMTFVYGFLASGQWREDRRASNLLDGGAHFYRVYETKDGGHVSIGSIEPQFYAELLQRLGLAEDDLYPQHDREHWEANADRLAAIFRTKTRDEWDALLRDSDICFAPVLTMSEAMEHPHNVERGNFVDLDGYKQPGPAPRFSKTPSAVRHGSTTAGQHTREALAGWGFSPDEIATLEQAAAVKQA